MKCTQCMYEDNCSLKEIANDLTGCEGHSKERPPKEGEVKCNCCKKWVNEKKAFKHINNNKHLCFMCY